MTARVDDRLFVPLRVERGRYRQDSGWIADPEFSAAIAPLLRHHCTWRTGDIEIRGRLYRVGIYVSDVDADAAYVEVDGNGVPVEAVTGMIASLARLTREYGAKVARRWRKSESITPDGQIPLDSWFIPPRLELLRKLPVSEAGESGLEIPWPQLADHSRVVVLGEPGAGKTSLLRRLVFEAAGDPRADTVPLYVQLRDFPVDDISADGLARFLSVDKAPELASLSTDAALSGRLLLLLDGLDEVPSEHSRTKILDAVTALCASLPSARVVLASRESTYRGDLTDFAHVKVLPFDQARAAQLTYQLVTQSKSARDWQVLHNYLRSVEHSDVLGNPLLLTILAAAYNRDSVRLADGTGILRMFYEALVDGWDQARGVKRTWHATGLSSRQMTSMLAELSYQCLRERRVDFDIDDVATLADRYVGLAASPVIFLNACHSAGLVRSAGDDRWIFRHQSFQDYLAAQRLVDSTDDPHVLGGRLADSYISRVWALSCGIASEASGLLRVALDDAALSRTQTAVLLAEALARDISAPKSLIVECCDRIVSILEECLADNGLRTMPREDENPDDLRETDGALRSEAAPRVSAAWSVTIAADLDATGIRHPDIFPTLMRLVHRARSSSAGDELERILRASDNALVRLIAASFARDGVMVVKSSIREREKLTECVVSTTALSTSDDIRIPGGALVSRLGYRARWDSMAVGGASEAPVPLRDSARSGTP